MVAATVHYFYPDYYVYYNYTWVKQQIERGIGNVAWAACWLWLNHVNKNKFTLDWVKQQIERGIGNVAWAACYLCLTNQNKKGITLDWTKQQIERGIGEVKLAANYLYTKGYVTKKWRDQQLAKLE